MIAYVVKETQYTFVVKCPYCRKKHTHGKPEGPRGSHCERGNYEIKKISCESIINDK